MKRKLTSYARFYALLNRMPGDRSQIKETLVARFTEGRTTSLRDMRTSEYEAMCTALEAEIEHPGLSVEEFHRERKRLRSAVLHRMQRLGIDTSDWVWSMPSVQAIESQGRSSLGFHSQSSR